MASVRAAANKVKAIIAFPSDPRPTCDAAINQVYTRRKRRRMRALANIWNEASGCLRGILAFRKCMHSCIQTDFASYRLEKRRTRPPGCACFGGPAMFVDVCTSLETARRLNVAVVGTGISG